MNAKTKMHIADKTSAIGGLALISYGVYLAIRSCWQQVGLAGALIWIGICVFLIGMTYAEHYKKTMKEKEFMKNNDW